MPHVILQRIFDLLEHPSDLIVNVSIQTDQACTFICTSMWVAISNISCN